MAVKLGNIKLKTDNEQNIVLINAIKVAQEQTKARTGKIPEPREVLLTFAYRYIEMLYLQQKQADTEGAKNDANTQQEQGNGNTSEPVSTSKL